MTTARISRVDLKVRQVEPRFQFSMIVLALMGVCPVHAQARAGQSPSGRSQEQGPDQQSQAPAPLKSVRESTARFQDVSVAEDEGYRLEFGCVSGPDSQAKRLHYVNDTLVGNEVLDATRPHIVTYEPLPDGGLKLTGADYLVHADAWDEQHPGTPPELMGQFFQLFKTPNRFGLPAFYKLHVWAWKENPKGEFVSCRPSVSC